MHLVIGLGNPGREYVGTRHNVGFELIDLLAFRWSLTGSPAEFDRVARTKFDGLAVDGVAQWPGGGSDKVLLLKPTTFMNLSGRAVQAAMAFYQLTPADVIVVLDDIALPCGKLRLRPNGSSGGHNGLKDIERALATSHYPRLRVGIDPPPPRHPQRDYVLGKFTDAQRQALVPALIRAVDAVRVWIEKGIEPAMNQFNAAPNDDKKESKKDAESDDEADKKADNKANNKVNDRARGRDGG